MTAVDLTPLRGMLSAGVDIGARGGVRAVSSLPLYSSRERAVRIRRGAGVHAYIGANGHFKSFTAAMDTVPTLRGIPWHCDNRDHLHTALGETSGLRRVLSTMRFTLPDGSDHPLWIPLDDYKRIMSFEHGDLVLDEVSGAAGAASGADDLPKQVKDQLQKLRARDVLCRHTAPGWNRATKVLRECTQMVSVCVGKFPVEHAFDVEYDGPHALPVLETDPPWRLQYETCPIDRPHGHDSGRQWPARRLAVVKTYDMVAYDEWTSGKAKDNKPLCRQLYWRPGLDVESMYDTFGRVETLGFVDDSGVCLHCGGTRRRPQCSCSGYAARQRPAGRPGSVGRHRQGHGHDHDEREAA
ncbi:MAG: hypothetical protein ACJ71Y_14110 [Blastococcus sp.]